MAVLTSKWSQHGPEPVALPSVEQLQVKVKARVMVHLGSSVLPECDSPNPSQFVPVCGM